jgi:hypothetical protein
MKIILTIANISSKEAVLKSEDGELVNWPLSMLPVEIQEGEKISFSIGENEALAKNILNEILS